MKKDSKKKDVVNIAYIPYHLLIMKKHKLSHTSTLLFGLIQLYVVEFDKPFYFNDEQIGEMLSKKKSSVQSGLLSLEEKGLIIRHSIFDRHKQKSARVITLGKQGKKIFNKGVATQKQDIKLNIEDEIDEEVSKELAKESFEIGNNDSDIDKCFC